MCKILISYMTCALVYKWYKNIWIKFNAFKEKKFNEWMNDFKSINTFHYSTLMDGWD